jgi:hypothetical protein
VDPFLVTFAFIFTFAHFHLFKFYIMFGLDKDNVQGQVGELVERLKANANLSDEQAQKVMETIKGFVVEKYPMLAGAVNSMFGDK